MPSKKVFVVDAEHMEDLMQEHAEHTLQNILDITKSHGACYLRFTKDDGMEIINPKYNVRINGAISDA